jgi:hypothetical protein
MSILFNSINQFVEQVGRRTTQRFGTVLNYLFVYTGPQSGYNSWAKQLGSSPDGFPLLYLSNIEKRNLPANVMEVTLYYIGTDQQGVTYTDLQTSTDLLAKSFSWSGVASSGGFLVQYSLEVQYTTVEVTFSYTTYKYQNGALFQNKAGQFTEVVAYYALETISRQLSPGTYTGYPTITHPIKPILTLTRFNCEQQTPNLSGTQGIWKCTETWGLNWTLGSLGLNTPNYVSP